MEFREAYEQLNSQMMDLLLEIRENRYDDEKAVKLKEQLIALYKDTVKSDEGRRVTKLAGITSTIMEELNGFVCATDDTDAGAKADDVHNDIAYELEQIAGKKI